MIGHHHKRDILNVAPLFEMMDIFNDNPRILWIQEQPFPLKRIRRHKIHRPLDVLQSPNPAHFFASLAIASARTIFSRTA
jgi:hypothetical protein